MILYPCSLVILHLMSLKMQSLCPTSIIRLSMRLLLRRMANSNSSSSENCNGKSDSKTGESRFLLTQFELMAALSIFCVLSLGLICIYWTMLAAEYQFLKVPRSIEEIQFLKDHLANYTKDYTAQVDTRRILKRFAKVTGQIILISGI